MAVGADALKGVKLGPMAFRHLLNLDLIVMNFNTRFSVNSVVGRNGI